MLVRFRGSQRNANPSRGMPHSIGQNGAMSDVVTAPSEQTTTNPITDDGDHDRFAHYVRKADATRATVEGTPVRALCGKVWVPSRDPSRYPICPMCEKIREQLLQRGGN